MTVAFTTCRLLTSISNAAIAENAVHTAPNIYAIASSDNGMSSKAFTARLAK
jgi:hypothetical protein